MKNYVKFTYIQIIVSCAVFFIIPLIFINCLPPNANKTITLGLIYSLQGLIIITLNYHLISEHLNRYKNCKDNLLYIALGSLLFLLVFLSNNTMLKGYWPTIDLNTAKNFSLFIPIFLFSYSFLFPISYCIIYKIITNNFSIKNTELLVILASSILFATLICIFYVPFNINLYITSFIFYFLITAIISYLYNQTGNIVISCLTFSIMSLIFQIVSILIK